MGSSRMQQLADLREVKDQVLSQARARGERPGLAETTLTRGSQGIMELVDMASKFSPAGPGALIGKYLFGVEDPISQSKKQLQKEAAALPDPEGFAENLANYGSYAAPYLASGVATAPLAGAGEAAALARGAGPTVARIGGQVAQEVPYLAESLSNLDKDEAALNSLLGIGIGSLIPGARGVKGTVSDIVDVPAPAGFKARMSQRTGTVSFEGDGGARFAGKKVGDEFVITTIGGGKGSGDEIMRAAKELPDKVRFDANNATESADAFFRKRIASGELDEGLRIRPPLGQDATAGPVAAPAPSPIIGAAPKPGLEVPGRIGRVTPIGAAPAAPAAAAPTPIGGPAAGGGQSFKPLPRDAAGEVDLPKYINENLNTERLDVSEGALQEMYNTGRIYGVDIKLAKGPKRTFEIVSGEANQLLANAGRVQRLLSHPADYVYTDTEGFALRQIYAGKNTLASDVSERYLKGEATDEEFLKSLDGVREMELKRVAGAAGAGRALGAMRMMADGKGINKKALEKIGEYLGSMGKNPRDIERFIKEIDPTILKKPGWGDKLYEWWINSLVSKSHGLNIMSGMQQYALQPMKRVVAAGLDVPISILRGGPREVRLREAGEMIKFKGLGEGLKNGWNYFKTGTYQGPTSATKTPHVEALTGPLKNIKFLGSRPLGAVDEVMSMLAYTADARASVFRQGISEGLSGPALEARAATLLTNLPDHIKDRALAAAKRGTFTDETAIGKIAGDFANYSIGGKRPFRWVVPFTRVGSSIVTQGIEMTPAGFGTVAFQRATGRDTGRALAEDLSAPTLGTMLGLTAWWLKSNGYLTGDSRPDASERGTMEAEGWQPNSLRIGGKYVSIQRQEPIGTAMLAFSNAVDAFEKAKDEEGHHFLSAGMNILRGIASDTWMKSVSDMMEMLTSEDTARVEKFGAKTAAGLVPNILRGPVKEFTGTTNLKTEGFLDTLGKEVGVQGSSMPRQDPFGREHGRDRTVVEKLSRSFGIPMSHAQNDPVIRERLRLGSALGDVGTATSLDPEGVSEKELFKDKAAQSAFRAAKGAILYQVDTALIANRKYIAADDNQKKTMLERSRSQAAATFNERWRKAGRPMTADGLAQLRINQGSVLKGVTRLKKSIRLSEADMERFGGDFGMFEELTR